MGYKQNRIVYGILGNSGKLASSYHNDPHFRAAIEQMTNVETEIDTFKVLLDALSDAGLTNKSLQDQVIHCKTVHPSEHFIIDI